MSLFRKKTPPPPHVAAVVVAAGSASRMGGVDKMQIPIGEIPVVVRSIQALCESPRIRDIVVVCREEAIADYYRLVQDYGLGKVATVVAGGKDRQESVFAGVKACGRDTEYFAIHDGARPFVRPEEIEGCIDAAIENGAAAVGVPVKDTIKVCGPGGMVESTPDRAKLYAIQTPQIFRADSYRQAMAQAVHYGRSYTDDCQLMEQTGRKVVVTPGSYENIKITTPEDAVMAQAILALREGEVDLWM